MKQNRGLERKAGKKMEHTKGKWEVQYDANGWIAIENDEGLQILRSGEEFPDDNIKIALEDARRIVKCCNAHDELVEALKALICDYTCQVPKSEHNTKTRDMIRQVLANLE